MMLGWSRAAAIWDSRTKRSLNLSSTANSGVRSFRAAFRFRPVCSARYTTLMPPRPRTDSMRYPAISVPMRGSELMGRQCGASRGGTEAGGLSDQPLSVLVDGLDALGQGLEL